MFSFGSKYAYKPSVSRQQEKDKEKDEKSEELEDKMEMDCEVVEFDDEDLVRNLNDVEQERKTVSEPLPSPAPQSGRSLFSLFSRSARAPPPPPAPVSSVQIKAKKPGRKIQNVNTNVFRVNLGFLSSTVDFATGDPNFCSTCNATLSSIDKLENISNNEGSQYVWTCRFCNTATTLSVEEEEIPKSDPVDYVLEAPLQPELNSNAYNIVFCIDISGSMCVTYEVEGKHKLKGNKLDKLSQLNDENAPQWLPGQNRNVTYVSRLQIVQSAIEAQIKSIAKENPNVRIAIVTFNNDVNVIGDGTTEVRVYSGDVLYNYEELLSQSTDLKLENPISETEKVLTQKLFSLEEGGQTALGPALLISTSIAAQKPGSKVVICTDGLANIGLGNMDTASEEEIDNSRKYYEDVGKFAKSNGVVLSVLTIPGSQAGIEQLGLLSELTNGTVDIVDPREMKDLFASMLSVPVVATNVSLKVIIYKNFFVREADQLTEENTLVKELGNATSESELSFTYGARTTIDKQDDNNNNNNEKKEELQKVPFQLQVYFTKLDGTKCIRVINPEQEITDDKSKAEKEAEVEILAPFAMDHAAKLAKKGDYVGARLANKAHKQLLERTTPQESKANVYNDYFAQNADFEGFIYEEQSAEIQKGESIFSNSEEQAKRRQHSRNDKVSNMLYNMSSANSKAKKMAKKY